VPPQVRPPEQSHVPLLHANSVLSVPQVLPQLPQLALLCLRSTQVPSQLVVPLGHTQAPALQTSPPRQRLPQAPQLFGSAVTSVQP
jgi:hypothetical protein